MDDKKAWEIVMRDLAFQAGEIVLAAAPSKRDILAALEHLRGKHAYFSRFKPGDEAVQIAQTDSGWQVVHGSTVLEVEFSEYGQALVFDYLGYAANESYCFPTTEEARAECDRRNKAGA